MSDAVNFLRGTKNEISRQSVVSGNIYLCTDTSELYVDYNTERILISDIIRVNTDNDLPIAPIVGKFYYVVQSNILYYYTGANGYLAVTPSVINSLDSTSTTNALSAAMGKYLNDQIGNINTISSLVDHEAHNNTNTWRKICEFSTNGHSNASGQCALSATILVTDGKYASLKKGDALLRIVTHREVTSGELHHINNKLALDFTTGEYDTNNNFVCKDPSVFKLTYTVNGTEITYKLWYYVNRAYLSTNFILLSATSSYDKKSIINEVNLSMGTLSSGATGYMNDNGVAATGVVDCEMGVIGNDIAGNAATATEANHAASADSATEVQQTFTNGNNNRPILLSGLDNVTTTTGTSDETVYSNKFYANPSIGELHAPMFKGGINTKVNLEGATTNAWRKICEYSSENHRNAGGQCGIVIEMLVYNTKDTSPKGGTALLKIMTYTDPNYPDKNELFIDFSAGRINRNNVYAHMDPSSFKLTYTDENNERIYKLWYYVTNANMGTTFTILSASSSYQSKSIASDVKLFWGTLSTGATGYMNDNGVAATGVVDCEMGVIGNDIAGNAASSSLANTLKTGTIIVSINDTKDTPGGWYQLAEWDISDVPSTYNFGYNILFLINGSKAYTSYGNAMLKVICYGAKKNVGDSTKFVNRIQLMSSTRVAGTEIAFTETMFKLTYKMDSTTKNITYKLWWYKNPSQVKYAERFSISLLMANDSESPSNMNIAYKIHLITYPNINYQVNYKEGNVDYEGYIEKDDPDRANIIPVNCTVGETMSANKLRLNIASTTANANANVPILCGPSANPTESLIQSVYKTEMTYNSSTNTLNVDNVNGNAKSATSISKSQDILLDSYLADNRLVIQDLFTNWKLIFIQGTWVRNNTTYTHEFVLPLNVLEGNRRAFTIRLHTGDQVVFWKVDNNTIKQGIAYGDSANQVFTEALVVGIY